MAPDDSQPASRPAAGAHRERRLTGVGASDGVVVGVAHLLADVAVPTGGTGSPEEQAQAALALQSVAARLGEAAARRRADGRDHEAEILEAAQLMADDPSLLDEIDSLAAGRPAVTAILEATERQADLLASIPDPYLAARAADVRRLGKQAARIAASLTATASETEHPRSGGQAGAVTLEPGDARSGDAVSIIVSRDLGPADFAELELTGVQVSGIALAEGSGTSHAAIVARALGVPLVVGLGDAVLSLADGETVVVDGTAGQVIAAPSHAALQAAQAEMARQQQRREHLAQSRAAGAITTDGHHVRLLANASTEREVLAALEAGGEGVGLLRTELAFLEAAAWPSAAEHAAAVRPVLVRLDGRLATVRTLDFGADKTPPFLRGRPERGIALQLAESGALAAQLAGLLQARGASSLRIMLPLVEAPEQVAAARQLLAAMHAEHAPGSPLPALGAMIETRPAVQEIDALAATADFLSIGTNDLAGDILGVDRLTPAATVRAAADPHVLQAIHAVTTAARRHGCSVEVCGEAAGDPRIAVLLLGLGVTELSAAPGRLDEVRAAVQSVSLARASTLAARALLLDSADAVLALLQQEGPTIS